MMVLNPETLSLKYFSKVIRSFFKKDISSVKPDTKGNLLIGTSQGLFNYNGQTKQIKHFTSANSQLLEGNVYEVSLILPVKGGLPLKPVCVFMTRLPELAFQCFS